jgi:hypothetical protein
MKPLYACGLVLLAALSFAGPAPAQSLAYVDAGGGALSPPASHGNHLYVGTGATLTTWDMTDPGQPIVVDRSSATPARGPVRALATVGDYLYAAWSNPSSEGGITIYSLADPAHPQVVAEYEDYVVSDFKHPSGLAASGDYVYLGDSENGLIVLDASNPLAPVNIGTVAGVNEFTSMGVYGGQLLTTGSSWIGGRIVHVIDISNPAAPVLAGTGALNGELVLRAVLTDGYAIGVGLELQIYDLHDPANIVQVYNSEIDEATHAVVQGDVLYLVGASGIQVWDFSTPALPSLLRTVPMDAFAPDQAADTPFGPLILTHTDRGLLLDVADPLNPTLAAAFTLPVGVNVHAAAFDGTHMYLAEEGYGLGVVDPLTLQTIGRYDADLPYWLAGRDMEDITVDAGRAYLAAWGYGVLIADVTDPAAPAELGRFEFPFASAIEAHGDRVYVASTTNGGIFKVLDVSDPAQPKELGSLATSQTYDLTVRGDYAYLADGADFGDGGLRIVDVSNPATPNVVGQDTGCPYANGVDVSADGNTVYIACASNASFQNELRIVDASDKANPALIGSFTLPGSSQLPDYNVAHSVAVSGNIAYVANEFGVDEIDITNPAVPVQITRHAIGYSVRKLALAPDGRVYAFAGEAGTFVFAPPASDAIFADGFY